MEKLEKFILLGKSNFNLRPKKKEKRANLNFKFVYIII